MLNTTSKTTTNPLMKEIQRKKAKTIQDVRLDSIQKSQPIARLFQKGHNLFDSITITNN